MRAQRFDKLSIAHLRIEAVWRVADRLYKRVAELLIQLGNQILPFALLMLAVVV